MRQSQQGFTLVEMSMVLLIGAALISAIFVGQSLIRAANLNAILSDAARYSGAFTDFRDKYNALAGDFAKAESFWGTPAGGCPNGSDTGKQVCNGNGDGRVCSANTAANIAELRSEWIELANAGFISASYQYSSVATGSFSIGVNTPISGISNGTFQFYYATCLIGDGLYSTITPYTIHWLSFGRLVSNTGILMPIVTGQEGYNIDQKSDDGLPGTGKIRAGRNATVYGYTPNCQTSAVATSAAYDQTQNMDVCYLMFALSQ